MHYGPTPQNFPAKALIQESIYGYHKGNIMLPVRNTLFEQLYLSFKKKVIKNFDRPNGLKTKKLIDEIINANGNNDEIHTEGTFFVKKLERRIEALESQNDQLIYFLDFLIDQLPELIDNSIFEKNNFLEDLKPRNEKIFTELDNLRRLPYTANDTFPNPTPREAEVLELLIKGFCAKEIANKLCISETTVITHKKNLKEKFSAKNTVELISKAYRYSNRNLK